MTISLLQLNIESARFLEEVIKYIKINDFDIVHLQEVSGNTFNKYHDIDTFEVLKERLGYDGVLSKTVTRLHDDRSYFGKATFFKTSFTLLSHTDIWLKPFVTLEKFPTENEDIKQLPHNGLHVILQKEQKIINCINTHLAWGPTPEDEPYKLDQAKILVDYIKKIDGSFILSGDFNVTPDSQIIKWLDTFTRNLVTEHAITNTLNPHVHRAKMLFPQGLAVDYIFVDKKMNVVESALIDTPDLSDHLGLQIKIEL